MKVIPELLQLLDLTGCLAVSDKIAKPIRSPNADCILAVKENQEQRYDDLKDLLGEWLAANFKQVPPDPHRTVNKGPGRIEIRDWWTIPAPEFLDYVRTRSQSAGLRTVVMLQAERRVQNHPRQTLRYYITSLANDARQILRSVRQHWSMENSLHGVLDSAFREDDSRMRILNSLENFARVRQVALTLLKQARREKIGIKAKRLKAACERVYLIQDLSG